MFLISLATCFNLVAATANMITPKRHDQPDVRQLSLDRFDDPNTYAQFKNDLQKDDGPQLFVFSPPRATFAVSDPSRSLYEPYGRQSTPTVRDENKWAALVSTLVADVDRAKRSFAIEAPEDSKFWFLPEILKTFCLASSFSCIIDDNAYSSRSSLARSNHRTRLLTNCLPLRALHTQKPLRAHKHVSGRSTRTKGSLFGELPLLRSTIGSIIRASFDDPVRTLYEGDEWRRTIAMTSDKSRKRALGIAMKEVVIAEQHRQRRTAQQAVAAGKQMKRRAFKPLLSVECHPGEAFDTVKQATFPFDAVDALAPDLKDNIAHIFKNRATINEDRRIAVEHWRSRAIALRSKSLAILKRQPRSVQKMLLRGEKLGQFYHVCLFEEMIQKAGHTDRTIAQQIAHGLNVVGTVRRSHAWPREEVKAESTIDKYVQGAWAYRERIEKESKRRKDHNDKIINQCLR